MSLHKSNRAQHMGVFVKKLYMAFTRFEIARYRPHRRQKTHLPVSEAFLLYCLCAYYLLDILEISVALNIFH